MSGAPEAEAERFVDVAAATVAVDHPARDANPRLFDRSVSGRPVLDGGHYGAHLAVAAGDADAPEEIRVGELEHQLIERQLPIAQIEHDLSGVFPIVLMHLGADDRHWGCLGGFSDHLPCGYVPYLYPLGIVRSVVYRDPQVAVIALGQCHRTLVVASAGRIGSHAKKERTFTDLLPALAVIARLDKDAAPEVGAGSNDLDAALHDRRAEVHRDGALPAGDVGAVVEPDRQRDTSALPGGDA